MVGTVIGINIGEERATKLRSVSEATLEAGRGIVGDRYHSGVGTFSKKLAAKPDREITLIEVEEIDRFNSAHGFTFDPSDFRRNIVTRGIRLNDLVGKTFRVGNAKLEGIRTCEPCKHLAGLLAPEVLPNMAQRAGLRARIVAGGIIAVEDSVSD